MSALASPELQNKLLLILTSQEGDIWDVGITWGCHKDILSCHFLDLSFFGCRELIRFCSSCRTKALWECGNLYFFLVPTCRKLVCGPILHHLKDTSVRYPEGQSSAASHMGMCARKLTGG